MCSFDALPKTAINRLNVFPRAIVTFSSHTSEETKLFPREVCGQAFEWK